VPARFRPSRARQLIEAGYRLSFAAAREGDLPHDLDLDPRAMRAQLAAEREGGAQRLAMAPVEQLMLRFFADGRDVRHVGTFSPPLDARVVRPLGMLEARALLVVEAMRHAAPGEPSEHARAIAAERLSEIALRSPGTNMAELSLALLTRCWGALADERVAALQDARA
jgi:hypothetical protein